MAATKKTRKRTEPAPRGPGNPVDSPWYSTPAESRARKPVTLTLSEKGRKALEKEASRQGLSLSATVEALLGVG